MATFHQKKKDRIEKQLEAMKDQERRLRKLITRYYRTCDVIMSLEKSLIHSINMIGNDTSSVGKNKLRDLSAKCVNKQLES